MQCLDDVIRWKKSGRLTYCTDFVCSTVLGDPGDCAANREKLKRNCRLRARLRLESLTPPRAWVNLKTMSEGQPRHGTVKWVEILMWWTGVGQGLGGKYSGRLRRMFD